MDLELQFDEQSSLKFSGSASEWAQVHDSIPDLDRLMKVRSLIANPGSSSELTVRQSSPLVSEPAPYPVRSYAPLPLPPKQEDVIEAEARTVIPPPALPPAPVRHRSYWKYAVLSGLAIGGIVLGVTFSMKMTPRSQQVVHPPSTPNKVQNDKGDKPLPVPTPPPPPVVCIPLPATQPPNCKS